MREGGQRVQWHVEEHYRVRLGKSSSVWGDLIHSLSLPDSGEILRPVRRKGSLNGVDRSWRVGRQKYGDIEGWLDRAPDSWRNQFIWFWRIQSYSVPWNSPNQSDTPDAYEPESKK